MTDLLEKTTGTEVVDRTTPTIPRGPAPPDRAVGAKWPMGAKALVVVLLVAAVLGAVGTVIGFTTGDDKTVTPDTTEMEATIDSLTIERNRLLSAYDAMTVDLVAQRNLTDVAQQARDDLARQVSAIETQIATITAQRDNLRTANANLGASLAAQQDELVAVEAERDALAALFPMRFDATLQGVDLVGTYDVRFTEVYCEGFATCGVLPPINEVVIQETPEGWLQVMIPGFTTTALHRVDGALYGITDTSADVFACGTTPRVARVAVTMFGHGLRVADDGSHQITDLGGSVTVQAPAATGCAAGLAFYGVDLAPQS